jgi:hypothetical protein
MATRDRRPKPARTDRNTENYRPETEIRQRNPRECRRFSPTGKQNPGDGTAWLGREDSNLRMAESKSAALPLGDVPSPRHRYFSFRLTLLIEALDQPEYDGRRSSLFMADPHQPGRGRRRRGGSGSPEARRTFRRSLPEPRIHRFPVGNGGG